MEKHLKNLIALLAGAQSVMAFAPFHESKLIILGMLLLLVTLIDATPVLSMVRGFLFGVGLFGFGVSWVFISIHLHGNGSIIVSSFITILFILFLSLFPALFGYLFAKIYKKNNLIKFLIVFPAFWVFTEFLRANLFTGFPWLLIGYSQVSATLAGLAPVVGVYGVSFFVAFIAGAIVAVFVIKDIKNTMVVLLLLGLIFLGSGLLRTIPWSVPNKKIKVALIQGNISQDQKWNEDYLDDVLYKYKVLTEQNINNDIIIWPEAAIPVFRWQAKEFIDSISKEAKNHKATIISGVLIESRKNAKYYNGMISFGDYKNTYLKRHLVPFGEYSMFRSLSVWLEKTFNIPMSNLSKGAEKQKPFVIDGINIAPSICYEVAYPSEIIPYLPSANILINISDDSWFGRSIASSQQLQIAQFRALESGRFLLAATNNGITAMINPDGSILKKSKKFIATSLSATVYSMVGETPIVWLYRLFSKI